MENTNIKENKETREVFAKIPYGVLQASNKINQYLLPTYLYIAINRNIFGELKTSVRSIREEYINTTNRRYWHEEEFYQSLLMLTASVIDEDNNSIYDNLINIKGLEDIGQMEIQCRLGNNKSPPEDDKLQFKIQSLDEQLKNLVLDFTEATDDNLKKKNIIISINSTINSKGFFKCTYDEYNAFKNFHLYLTGKSSRISICQAINAYFTIKYIIKRNEALKEMGILKKHNPSQVSKSLLKRECNFTDYTIKAVIQLLIDMKLICIIPDTKKENGYYIMLNEKNEKE